MKGELLMEVVRMEIMRREHQTKLELATLRATLAEQFYRMSEPMKQPLFNSKGKLTGYASKEG